MESIYQSERLERLERELREVKAELHREVWRREMAPLRALVWASYGMAALSLMTLAYVLASR